ncbi:hypothetical protein [Novosphingobium sp. BW1]|uniref:hypothetical protein n=1 Tax=Novosphingobium sp. BW1 TaxID=2592621 RepID=UPI0013969170|nr:hypothetical protein [Novosphingobium sp. BW1]
MISGATDAVELNQFLSLLNGMPLHSTVRSALATRPADLLAAVIDGVVRLLGTLAILDRNEAIAWGDAIWEQELVDRLAPALDCVLNLIIRGKSVSDAQLTAMNSVTKPPTS